MEDKKYIKIIKDEFYYEVFYLEDDEIEKSCFVFKDVLTPTRLESFESEFPNVNYNKPFFVISYIDGELIKVLNANEVKSYKDLTKIIENGGY